MAVTQLYNRTTNLNGLIEYVMNGDKTDEMKYVSGVNCLPETAYEEMIATKIDLIKELCQIAFVNIMDYLY